ncbi:hypothetical protein ANO14919_048860 [Xylariales sp. No.14919]|nr:hypothetical protein ANO14919_048860 [Xylariales sp. No.14919]
MPKAEHIYIVLALIACPLAVLAASISRDVEAVPSGPFSAGAWKIAQGTDVFFFGTAINATGGKFYINRDTSTYCPEGVSGLDCTAFSGSGTSFAIGNGTTTMSLDVTVPGGQQVYVAPDGSLSYTQAHSASMPPGSIVTGFSREQSQAFGAPIYLYSADLSWYLCPVTEGEPRERTYQIFASSEAPEGCYGTQVRTYTPGSGRVWQYA